MKKAFLLLALTSACLICFSQEQGTFRDPRDGQVYKIVKIGSQTWFAEDLKYKPDAGNYWAESIKIDQADLERVYYVYDWKTAMAAVPKGWHLPSKAEFKILYEYLGDSHKKVYNALVENGSSGFNVIISKTGYNQNAAIYWTSNKPNCFSLTGPMLATAGKVYVGWVNAMTGERVRPIKDN